MRRSWTNKLAVLAGLIVVFSPVAAQAATLQQLLSKQAELQAQAEANKKKIAEKKSEAANLQQAIGDLDSEITDTQEEINNTNEQISVTNAVIEELAADIATTQKRIDDHNEKLKVAYVNLYELSQTSPIETFFASDSLNEVVTQTQYIESIQQQLQADIAEASNALHELEGKKNERESQKTNLQKLQSNLSNDQRKLNRQRAQKDRLLSTTQGEQAKYEDILKKLVSQQESISQEIYDARRAQGGGEQVIFGTGGYPWPSEPNEVAVDPWLFYKRQCTSYAAWKFGNNFGQVFYNTRPGQGSAWNWPALARDQGYQTSSTPQVNSVVSWPQGRNMPYGHVAWVTAVHGNGTIDVEEYNWTVARSYSKRLNVDPSRYGSATYIFP